MLRPQPDSLDATAKIIYRQIDEGKVNPMVMQLRDAILRNVPDRLMVSPEEQDRREIAAVFSYVRDHIRYTRDPRGIEVTSDPEATIRRGQGDCDDHVALVGALIESAGHRYELWLSGFSNPTHIYGVAYPESGGGEIPLDTTLKREPMGSRSGHPNHWRVARRG